MAAPETQLQYEFPQRTHIIYTHVDGYMNLLWVVHVLVKTFNVQKLQNTYKIWNQSTITESSCISLDKVNTIGLEISLRNCWQEIVIAAIEQRIAEDVQGWCKRSTADLRDEMKEPDKDDE